MHAYQGLRLRSRRLVLHIQRFAFSTATIVVAGLLVLAGCSSKQEPTPQEQKAQAEAEAYEQEKAADEVAERPLPYTVRFTVVQGGRTVGSAESDAGKAGAKETAGQESSGQDSSGKEASGKDASGKADAAKEAGQAAGKEAGKRAKAPKASDAGYLAGKMDGVSQLVALAKRPPDGELGLERRARLDLATAEKLMRSEGFYEGKAEMRITGAETGKATVEIVLHPGVRYVVGDVTVLYQPKPRVPKDLESRAKAIFPVHDLAGVNEGEPATASEMLSGVNALVPTMKKNGYPDAKLEEQHYYLDRRKRTLNALVLVDPGECATLGRVVVEGKSEVNAEFIQRMAPWDPGEEYWDTRRVDEYITKLRRTGLFKNVTAVVVPGRDGQAGESGKDASQKPVGVKVEDAKHRTIGGLVRYDTDTGFGVEGSWEHRNLFHNGEKLTVTAPVSLVEAGVKAKFVKPEFYAHGQQFLASASALRERSDGYDRNGVSAEAGVERQFNKVWYAYGGGLLDVGTIKSNEASEQGYSVYGGQFKLRRDTRNDTMNPTSGSNIQLGVKPLTGEYDGSFTAVGTVLSMAGYYAPWTNPKTGEPDDKLVLAAKVEAGSYHGAPLHSIPPSHRYYLGGAGSVRGYGYQQIGPMDDENEPEGARSYQLVNLETRFKVTDSLGFVAFLDGGMAYRDEMPKFDLDMDYGAGLGVRYFTPIGPVRFDVAVPLKENPNPPLQFYISIGQAF